jgi:adenylate cyclase
MTATQQPAEDESAAPDVDAPAPPDPSLGSPSAFADVLQILVGEPSLSIEDVAREARMPLQILREVFDAVGWRDRPGYDERDVAYATAVSRLLDLYPLDTVVRNLRNRYRAMTSIVISDLGTVRDHVVGPALVAGVDAEEIATRLGRAAEEILPLVTSQLTEDYRHVLVRLLGTEALARGVRLEGGRELALAVGFVDIVGYTALSGQVDPAGLDHVLSGFEDLVTSTVTRADDVLLAKFVGDAAMLVASDPMPLADLLLGLVDDRQRLAEAPRRAGMAAGQVLVREGDYYGPVVNLAARLTDHAYPWTLLVDEDLRDTFADRFALERTGKVSIQGVGDRRPVRLRRKVEAED